MENALIAGTAEFERQIALTLDEGAIDQGIELADKIPDWTLVRQLFKNEASEGPNVPAQLFVAEFGNFIAGFGLEQGFATAEGEAALPFKLAQLILDLLNFN